jgi:hypothetical protein
MFCNLGVPYRTRPILWYIMGTIPTLDKRATDDNEYQECRTLIRMDRQLSFPTDPDSQSTSSKTCLELRLFKN